MTTESSVTIIAICQLILTAAGIALVIGLVYGIFAFKKMVSAKVDEAMAKIQPVVDQAKSIADQAKETAETVSSKVDSIMAKAEDTAGKVSDKVQSVSDKVEGAISPQVVATAGLVGAIVKCVELYRDISKLGGPTPAAETDEQSPGTAS